MVCQSLPPFFDHRGRIRKWISRPYTRDVTEIDRSRKHLADAIEAVQQAFNSR